MAYKELGKLYYGNQSVYIEEYNSRFNSENTVKLDFRIKQYPAFYVLTPEIQTLVYEILKADKRILALRTQLPQLAGQYFSKKCLIDEIILTNQIEGVHSTRREIGEVLEDLEERIDNKHTRKRFYGLVLKYVALQTGEKVELNSCEDIRNLYDTIVLKEVVEENPSNAPDGNIFRKDAASVNTITDQEIHRGVYPESAICEAMDRALAFLNNNSINMLFRIGIFHYFLEYIHPFYDGNGRLGRFIVSYLISQELDPLLAYRISYTITENISTYYSAFKTCNNPRNMGDVTPFLIMMLQMINKSCEQLEEALSKRLTRFNRYMYYIPNLPHGLTSRTNRVYQLLIQAGLFAENGISTQELKDCIEVSYTTLKKELEKTSKLLITERVGHEIYYHLDLDALDRIMLEDNTNN